MKKLINFLVLNLFVFIFTFITRPTMAVTLPDGYTELEYIESTGTQYIDMGFVPTSDYKHTLVFSTTDDGTGYIAGTGTDGGRGGNVKLTGGTLENVYIGSAGESATALVSNPSSYSVTGKTTLVMDLHNNAVSNVFLNGRNISSGNVATIVSTGSLDLFGSAGVSPLKSRIYQDIIEQNGVLVRNFIPAKNSSGVIGMYDTVNNRFYTNAGTGSFIAGPETTGTCANMFNMDWLLNAGGWTKNGGVYTGANGNQYEYAKNGYPITFAPNTQYIITGHFGNNPGLGRFEVVYTDDTTGAIAFNTSVENTDLFAKTYPGKNVKSLRFNYANTGVMEVSNIQVKPAYCSEIQVASTKYTETVFNPLNTALANAVATVNTVVTNTINQAASIATLQSGKQTRPADDTECPAYKQCLLVEDESGTPHWYQITDPFRDFFTPIIANQTNGNTTAQQAAILGYTQLEYIESTGTQYINTGVVFDSNKEVEIAFQYISHDGTYNDLFGISSAGSIPKSYLFRVDRNGNVNIYIGRDLTPSFALNNNKHTIKTENKKVYFDNESKGSYDNMASNPINAYLFATNLDGAAFGVSVVKIYYAKIWNNGTLIRNFVPVIDNTTGKVGMYDTVGGRFYGNAASSGDDFTPGPIVENDADVPVPTWYVDWNANSAINLSAGTAIGTAVCNSSPAGATPITDSGWNTVGAYCWCKLTGINVGGEYTAAPDAAPWKKIYTFDGATNCATGCNGYCAYHFRNQNSTRVSLTEF